MPNRYKKIIIIVGILLLIFILNYKLISNHTWNQWSLPLTGRVIVIDAGHGGPDGGAEAEGKQEKEVALKIAGKVRNYLQESGALVLMTREKDNDLADKDMKGLSRRKTQDLIRRAKFVNNADPDAMISIHLNAIPSPKWSGAQTFYHPKV